ncbi:MAG: amiloride-sensitive sodium channel family protein, partial [bacterium]
LYKYSLSFSQLNGGDYVSTIKNNSNLASDFINRPIDSTQAEKSFVRLNVFYDSLSYTLTTESPQMDWVTLLGSIGGNLGLFLGVSVFSLCEIFEVIVQIKFFT